MSKSVPVSAMAVAAALIGVPPSAAQNSFRPLPPMPEFTDWGRSAPTARLPSLMEELELASQWSDEEFFVEAQTYLDFAPARELEGGGFVGSQHGGLGVTIGRRLQDDLLAALSVDTEAYFYDFSGPTQLVPGSSNPFNDLYEARIAGLLRTRSGAAPGWFGGLTLNLGGEDEAALGDSLTLGGVGGVRYSRSDDFEVELGLAALSRLEDDPWVWPYLGFRWKPAEALTFEARGTSVEGRIALEDDWSFLGRVEYTLHQFRLNDDNPLPSGVLRDETVRAGFGVERRGANGVTFEVHTGFNIWRELSTLDESGTDIAEVEVGKAPFLALRLAVSL